ncbi:MAG: MaoC family dehydratase [Chloroflexi bacterium]|nr:MaoC family dehydratase [Chloroflexota bacterium]
MAKHGYDVGQALPEIVRTVTAEVMYSRQWAGTNPVHSDPKSAARQGMKAPVVTGQLSAAYIQEACVAFFGEAMWRGSVMDVSFKRPVYLGDTLTAGGRVESVSPEGGRRRVVVAAWARNQKGEEVTTVRAEAVVVGSA